jgi:phage replication-related protein YjqB (UPF0714/DUF867 family)
MLYQEKCRGFRPELIQPDRYSNFAALAAIEIFGRDFTIIAQERPSPLLVAAPHGGTMEPGTSELAALIAGSNLSLYCFESLKGLHDMSLHITSSRFDEPQLAALSARAVRIISVHGCEGEKPMTFVGGASKALNSELVSALRAAGFPAACDRLYPGELAANICNRGRLGAGLQLEVTHALRDEILGEWNAQSFSLASWLHKYVAAIRAVALKDLPQTRQLPERAKPSAVATASSC